MTCHSWTLLNGHPPAFFPSPSDSASNIPASMNLSGHFDTFGGGTTTVSADEFIEEETDSVSVSFSFLDFLLCEMTTSECRLARLLA